MFSNAHLHFKETFSPADFCGQNVCFCAGSAEEFASATSFVQAVNGSGSVSLCSPAASSGELGAAGAVGERRALVSAGLHPWTVAEQSGEPSLGWLERLLQENADEVAAIGECGIDLYTPELKAALPAQLYAFEKQIDLAVRYEKPLVVHCRRSIQYFFEYAPRLKKLRSVIFHAYPGTFAECESLLNRGINAYFSFGGSFLRGGKHAAECVKKLPADRLLLETDDEECAPALLKEVFGAAADIRGTTIEELCVVCANNFRRAFLC
ncbi:MAG: TatD family hydrolase [Spirochaetaceae bacterium]|nr:TatD family hydrolase [Spirochaetaceae bacterium]